MTKKQRKQEFLDNRTSWKWFNRIHEKERNGCVLVGATQAFSNAILIEILKELQFKNDL